MSVSQLLDGLKEAALTLSTLRPEAQIFVMKLLPSGRNWNPRREVVANVNSKLESVLKGIATVIDCDMASLGPHDCIEPGMMFDFAHLTQEGYSKVFESVFNTLNNFLSM
ncbi:hypothetical protein L596_003592 [Steinernema carpocapsae]|uniref:SGNH hydrolase-type esterase domain-containing protein n=1 Tax=Steinernema carpocapsae TaxID=34508 RepID=A0A4U8UUP3_STECR|nr:hypothetical protein L596_003592 [Steinernema carpocapsae]